MTTVKHVKMIYRNRIEDVKNNRSLSYQDIADMAGVTKQTVVVCYNNSAHQVEDRNNGGYMEIYPKNKRNSSEVKKHRRVSLILSGSTSIAIRRTSWRRSSHYLQSKGWCSFYLMTSRGMAIGTISGRPLPLPMVRRK